LSIVIPAYNEERRLPPSLEKIVAYLRNQSYTSEILVVENGSTDATSAVVQAFIDAHLMPDDPVRLLLLHSSPGKGAAVKCGMLAAQGDYRFICDADLAMPIEEIAKFLPPALAGGSFDIAIASRELPGAVRYDEPVYRHVMGRVFNWLVRVLAVPGIQDTQCGFKMFTREAAQILFPLQRIDGWGFDVEVLYIALRHGMRLTEVPINWYYQSDSRVRPLHDTINMVRELLKIRRNGASGFYETHPQATADELPVV
jgi:dolichyl-phosphate beta-glucosyltransferase